MPVGFWIGVVKYSPWDFFLIFSMLRNNSNWISELINELPQFNCGPRGDADRVSFKKVMRYSLCTRRYSVLIDKERLPVFHNTPPNRWTPLGFCLISCNSFLNLWHWIGVVCLEARFQRVHDFSLNCRGENTIIQVSSQFLGICVV